MQASPQVRNSLNGNELQIEIGGTWSIDGSWPTFTLPSDLAGSHDQVKVILIRASGLQHWDSSLLVYLVQVVRYARANRQDLRFDLPDGLKRLVSMVFAVPARAGTAQKKASCSILEGIGGDVLAFPARFKNFLNFIGSIFLSSLDLLRGRSRMRAKDFYSAFYQCGVQSLPIISLTTMLFGLILAFVGAVQLTQFGAQIYVAGLVGIGMLRVMGAVMVGVVMSGRIGAAYAALIGTMQVNEEIDALETLGISPIDFLVLPRLLALALMVPLLTLYADIMGILGGYLVATTMLDINPMEYLAATRQMVAFRQVIIGLVYAGVFGVVIAVAACYQGMKCGRSAEAVGKTTTTAVVYSIVGIIVATSVITVICNIVGV